MPSDPDNSQRTAIYGFFKPQIGAQHFGRRVNANWDVIEAILADARDLMMANEDAYTDRLAELEQRIAALEPPETPAAAPPESPPETQAAPPESPPETPAAAPPESPPGGQHGYQEFLGRA